MSGAANRCLHIGASFTQQYYTKLIRKPSELPDFYVQDALFEHLGHTATGVKAIQQTVDRLYPVLLDAVVKIDSVVSEAGTDGDITLTIKGVLTVSPTLSNSFTHEVVLREHKTHPGSFGVVRDRRVNNPSEETKKRWAHETPPMFAQEAPEEKVPPMEELVPSAVVDAGECKGPTAPDADDAADGDDGDAVAVVAPEPAAEPPKPKSFAEAIKSGKSVGSSSTQVASPVVVVKSGNEQSNGKASNRDSAGGKKSSADRKHPGGGSNGKEGGDRPSGKANGSRESRNRSKGKDAEGRVLSRNVVFYDVIVKGLPSSATEQNVRDIIEPVAPVELVKLLSRNDKKDTHVMRTVSFVKLDHDAIKGAGGDVKATIKKLLESAKLKRGFGGSRVQIDVVREKYTAVPVSASSEAAAPG